MKDILKKVGLGLVAVFVLYTFYFLWAQAQDKPVVYEIIEPQTGDIEKSVTATGTLQPRTEVSLKPKVNGTIEALYVKVGDRVSAGQVIARIKITPNQTIVTEAQAGASSAQAVYDVALKEYNRCKELFDKKVISRRELEQAEGLLNEAKAKLKGANEELNVARHGYSSENVTEVRSTINGTIMEVPLKIGAAVVSTNDFSDGTTIAVIADLSELIFKGTIDEANAAFLHAGQSANIRLGAVKDKSISGVVETIAPRGKENNGAILFDITAKASLPEGMEIRTGYSANADIVLESRQNVLRIEEGAVEYEDDNTYVYVLTSNEGDDQTFEKKPVKLGLSDGINVEVISGISKNDKLRGLVKN